MIESGRDVEYKRKYSNTLFSQSFSSFSIPLEKRCKRSREKKSKSMEEAMLAWTASLAFPLV